MHCDTRRSTRSQRATGTLMAAGMGALLVAAGYAGAAAPALVPVGDAGNAADMTGFGAVSYAYRIGTYEVTRAEYAAFLNAVASTDTHGLYHPAMGIARSGAPGSYLYAATDGTRAVAFVSWYDTLRFANWLHNGQPVGTQGPSTTEDGAYTLSGDTVAGARKPGARYFLPAEDEWYKAAYYQGGADAFYWRHPTRSDEPPLAAPPPGGDNSANYDRAVGTATAAGAYAQTQGHYGTRDQAGNLWEWNETAIDGGRGLRGGSYDDYQLLLEAWYQDSQDPVLENEFVGFRIAAAPETILPCDLVASALTAPATGGAGLSIAVNDTTMNQSTVNSAGTSVTRFYLSANSTWDSADVQIGSRVVPALAAGAASTATTVATIPAGTAFGTWYVIAKADAEGVLPETSETNNTRSRSIRIGADLSITSILGPINGGANRTVTVTVTTRNAATGSPTAPSTTRFYLSANATWDAADVAIGSCAVPALAAGATNTASAAVLIPPGTTAGMWYVFAKADADGVVPETSETNNTRGRSILVGPDLTVSALTALSSVRAGTAVSVTDTTRNSGGGDAVASTSRIYLSLDTTWDVGDQDLGSRSVPALGPAVSSSGSTPLLIPAGTAAGTWYLIARADADGAVPETSERNNTRYRAIAVTVVPQ